jgi:hypothetical protein
VTPPKKENSAPGVQQFTANHIEGVRTSDILRAVADQMDSADALTEADSEADLAGTPRPDHPTVE